MRQALAGAAIVLGMAVAAAANERTAAERGKAALLGEAFIPPAWSTKAYQEAGKAWPGGAPADPEAYAEAFRERYGLHPAPYANGRYPMGLREANFFGSKALANDCMLCHASSIFGQSYIGLGNPALDFQALFEDLNRADGRAPRTPFVFSNVRGTTEAGSMAVFLIAFRTPDLDLRMPLKLGIREHLCEDTPAWWLLKKKKTMYHTGSSDARSVRSLMQFMLNPLNLGTYIKGEEKTFADIRQYLLSLQPPRYPLPIDRELAARGERLFVQNCSRCHGTYGANWTYPNKIVPIDVIGTDPTRWNGFTDKSGEHYNQSWFAREREGWLVNDYPAMKTAGYQAPPLDGLWATAPYFHNGSVPTVYDVLNSRTRPAVYTRSFRTDQDAYDPIKLGWKVRMLDNRPEAGLSPFEQRKIYDTRQPGRGNGGHTFGDKLTEDERSAVIEYLKTL